MLQTSFSNLAINLCTIAAAHVQMRYSDVAGKVCRLDWTGAHLDSFYSRNVVPHSIGVR